MLRHMIVFVLVGLVTLWPLAMPIEKDDFPFSPFAMFSDKKDAFTTVTQAAAVDREGRRQPLAPRYFGTSEVLQARATLARIARSNKKAQIEACEALAARVRADAALAGAESIEVRTVTYETLAYFEDPTIQPQRNVVHVRCAVRSP